MIKSERGIGENIHITLTVDGDECEFNHVAPIDLEGKALKDFVKSREDSYKFDILRDMYPNSGQSNLKDMEKWIKAGHTVDGKVIEKVPWTGTHPPEIQTKADLAKAVTVEERLDILERYLNLA